MPERKESSITFTVEESVWFETGQEVDELISISLAPHIELYEEEEYVILKGTLELSGEYRHANLQDHYDFPIMGRKYIQSVENRNEFESEFFHHFPLDITVPKRKIKRLEDIALEIDSFDYHLPENSKLQLMASFVIKGIYEEADQTANNNLIEEREEEEVEVKFHIADESLTGEEDVEINREEKAVESIAEEQEECEEQEAVEELEDVTREVEEINAEEVMDAVTAEARSEDEADPEAVKDMSEVVIEEDLEVAREDEVVEANAEIIEDSSEKQDLESPIVVKYIPFKTMLKEDNTEQNLSREKDDPDEEESLYHPFTVEATVLPKEEEIVGARPIVDYHPSQKLPEISFERFAQLTRDYFPESTEQEIESSSGILESSSHHEIENDEKVKGKKKKDKYKSMSFADFFARKEGDSATKLKMCLVQHGDSIQELADKYQVTVQQILRANQLEASHEVYGGEVLYIPVKSSKVRPNG